MWISSLWVSNLSASLIIAMYMGLRSVRVVEWLSRSLVNMARVYADSLLAGKWISVLIRLLRVLHKPFVPRRLFNISPCFSLQVTRCNSGARRCLLFALFLRTII
jgi:hypothetical protein